MGCVICLESGCGSWSFFPSEERDSHLLKGPRKVWTTRVGSDASSVSATASEPVSAADNTNSAVEVPVVRPESCTAIQRGRRRSARGGEEGRGAVAFSAGCPRFLPGPNGVCRGFTSGPMRPFEELAGTALTAAYINGRERQMPPRRGGLRPSWGTRAGAPRAPGQRPGSGVARARAAPSGRARSAAASEG